MAFERSLWLISLGAFWSSTTFESNDNFGYYFFLLGFGGRGDAVVVAVVGGNGGELSKTEE